jgi:hypothetical protein
MTDICTNPACQTLNNGAGCVHPLANWWNLPAPAPQPTTCDLQVDPAFGFPGTFGGTVYTQVRECDSTDVTTVIDVDDEWTVDVHITVSGKLVGVLCGFWCISACLEGMCAGDVYRFPQESTSPPGFCCLLCSINQGQTDYDAQICVPANKVDVNECGAPYELTVIVTALSQQVKAGGDPNDPNAHVPLGIATACELPLMTFYEGI